MTANLVQGRAATAAEILEAAYPPERAPWDIVDRIATLQLHLGEPEKARELWQRATAVPSPAVRDARWRQPTWRRASSSCTQGLRAGHPSRSVALRGAVWPGDPGARRRPCRRPPMRMPVAAIESAPNEVARSAARAIASAVSRFARAEVNGSDRHF